MDPLCKIGLGDVVVEDLGGEVARTLGYEYNRQGLVEMVVVGALKSDISGQGSPVVLLNIEVERTCSRFQKSYLKLICFPSTIDQQVIMDSENNSQKRVYFHVEGDSSSGAGVQGTVSITCVSIDSH